MLEGLAPGHQAMLLDQVTFQDQRLTLGVGDSHFDLLDLLHAAQQRLGSNGTYEIISAYRSPATNEMLRRKGAGVARRSMPITG